MHTNTQNSTMLKARGDWAKGQEGVDQRAMWC